MWGAAFLGYCLGFKVSFFSKMVAISVTYEDNWQYLEKIKILIMSYILKKDCIVDISFILTLT